MSERARHAWRATAFIAIFIGAPAAFVGAALLADKFIGTWASIVVIVALYFTACWFSFYTDEDSR